MKVLAAVDAVRRGQRVEDDLVECKSDWPDTEKARQFAGLCNRARGHPVLLIVGLDEKTGRVTTLNSTDPANWWPSFSARFDEVAPDLDVHMVVPVGNDEQVVALLFGTGRVPYVVKSSDGTGPHREIPMRAGTATRAAYRHEIVKMLGPTINLPSITALSAEIFAARRISPGGPASEETTVQIAGTVWVYIEHLAADFAMIPAHRIEARLSFIDVVLPVSVQTAQSTLRFFGKDESPPTRQPERRFGVDARHDGLLVTGPGRTPMYFSRQVNLEDMEEIATAKSCKITMTLYVDGSDVPVRLVTVADRQDSRNTNGSEVAYWASPVGMA